MFDIINILVSLNLDYLDKNIEFLVSILFAFFIIKAIQTYNFKGLLNQNYLVSILGQIVG